MRVRRESVCMALIVRAQKLREGTESVKNENVVMMKNRWRNPVCILWSNIYRAYTDETKGR